MDIELVKEVQACLRGDRTLFYYYPDHYAVYLILRMLGAKKRVAIRTLRNSRISSVLNRPVLQDLIQACGDGYIYRKDLEAIWHDKTEPYVLTLGEWGNVEDWTWDQVSRPGTNLVLQLNVSNKWSRPLQKLLSESVNQYSGLGHPVSDTRSMTLAWARLDIDFQTDEVLVEEIQSDCIRDLAKLYRKAALALSKGKAKYFNYGVEMDAQNVTDITGAFLDTFKKSWHEAMLTAAMKFSFEELGVTNLYYHSFDTGNKMKNLEWSFPPRSLYTELPKRFCFSPCAQAPEFLRREKKLKRKLRKLEGGIWFYMAA